MVKRRGDLENIPNIVHLIDEKLTDYLAGGPKYHKESYEEHVDRLRRQMEAGAGRYNDFLFEYFWYGRKDQKPWRNETKYNIPFDPTNISVIVPKTSSMLSVLGENRKIVLSFPEIYGSDEYPYFVNCSSEKTLDNIRVLEPGDCGNPFDGLEKLFTERGFSNLPKLSDTNFPVILAHVKEFIIYPENNTYFF